MLEILGFVGSLATAFEKAYADKMAAQTDEQRQAADMIIADLKEREATRRVMLQHWWSAAPMIAAMWLWFAYFFKTVFIDTMLGLGSTPELHGAVGDWLNQAGYLTVGGTVSMALIGRFTPK